MKHEGRALRKIRSFLENRQGNFSMMLVLAFPAMFAAVALAVDISNQLRNRTELQDANDSAVLYAARYYQVYERLPTPTQVGEFIQSNTTYTVTNPTISMDPVSKEITVTSETQVRPMLMGYFGSANNDYKAVSRANTGVVGILEFALALDVTGSMKYDGRIQGLKTAATNFVNYLYDVRDKGAQIKGSVVPFSRYVNVGISRRNEPWMNVPPDIDTRHMVTTCSMTRDVVSQNCTQSCTQAQTVFHPAVDIQHPAQTINHPAVPPTCTVDDGVQVCSGGTPAWTEHVPAWHEQSPAWTENIPASCGNQCTPVYGPEYETCETHEEGELITWYGCVGSRPHPWNLKDANPSLRFPGPLGIYCNAELLPLTDNRNGLLARINALTPYDETYIPDGVMWGTRVLSPQIPFTEGMSQADTSKKLRKVLVVMTDGMNTLSPVGELHTGTNQSQADSYTAQACTEAKDQGLEVYTISFGNQVPTRIRNLLKQCASEQDQYFHAANSAALNRAFKDIADNLLSVRLTH